MKRFEYTFQFRGTVTVFADNDDEAQEAAQEQMAGITPDLEQIEKIDSDPSGGDQPDD